MTRAYSARVSRYVVTGCAGFIGSHLVDSLVADGHEVLGLDAFTDYYPRAVKEANLAYARRSPSFSLVEADLAAAPIGALLGRVDGVFHLAGQPGVRTSWGASFETYVHHNILASRRLFEAAAGAGVRVVYASTSSVYGESEVHPTPEDVAPRPASGYGVTKLAAEQLAGAYASSHGLDVVILRYFSAYGPRQRPDMAFARITSSLVAGTPFELFGNGEQARDFTYVADVVEATRAAMERAPAAALYNVGGDEVVSLVEAIGLFEAIAGRRLEVRRGETAVGDVRRTSADTSRIRAELGWRPRTSLADGIAAQLRAAGLEISPPEPAPTRALD